ncbi:MAG: N-acetyl-gamma-glutamyl-phosphate reductase [Actinomycetota bacterium]|nr:N-acetyl-gamma-glutamyl-phosphate reductase [Actinomycetota bacterium]
MKVGIIGASGYAGAELLRILYSHPGVSVAYVAAHTYAGWKVADLYPHLHVFEGISFEEFRAEEALSRADFHFVALPHGKSMEVVPALIEGGAKVVDLSADYRISDAVEYSRWYGLEHTSQHLLEEAVYGLPEINAEKIAGACLVANPGCYPTAVILALAPLAERGPAAIRNVIADAKSGVSGAGRGLSLTAHFAQAEGSVKPYAVGSHRHIPEMEEVLSAIAGSGIELTFAPHLVPMSRGILATCYVGLDPQEGLSEEEIRDIYLDYYRDKPFVVLLELGLFPETKAVCGSNYCHVGLGLDKRVSMVIAAAAVDNLVKGASGQAVQCMNIMQGWKEETGLEALGIFP